MILSTQIFESYSAHIKSEWKAELRHNSPSGSKNGCSHVVAHPIDLILWLEAAKSIHLLINGVLINAGDCL